MKMSFFWIFKAFRVVTLIGAKLPGILEDGVITVEEAMALLVEILRIFDLDMDIKLPENSNSVMEIKLK